MYFFCKIYELKICHAKIFAHWKNLKEILRKNEKIVHTKNTQIKHVLLPRRTSQNDHS
jgi:hypothetical protein